MTARSFSEYIHEQPHNQIRILNEQKYPKKAPGPYMVNYYAEAQRAIRGYYRSGNDLQVLAVALTKVQASTAPDARKKNNIRAIKDFRRSPEAVRQIVPVKSKTLTSNVGTTDLRITFDIQGTGAKKEDRLILYNFRKDPVSEDVARVCLELANWIFEKNGQTLKMRCFDFVDLVAQKRYNYPRRRALTLKNARTSTRMIAAIWPGL